MTEVPNSEKYQEILNRLEDIRQEKVPSIPLIDPTANVKELVEMERRHHNELAVRDQKRQDDLREQAEHYTEKLASERMRAAEEAKHAEAGRIDSLLVANTNSVALALAKQEAQAQAQDKRIAALEQNQYQGVGGKLQMTEGRQQNQWTFQQTLTILAIAIAIASFVVHIWK